MNPICDWNVFVSTPNDLVNRLASVTSPWKSPPAAVFTSAKVLSNLPALTTAVIFAILPATSEMILYNYT